MKKNLLLFLAIVATTALWASNEITYKATRKLPEAKEMWEPGFHINAFNVAITSHVFADSVGTITFEGEVTSIGESAFIQCSTLTSITIPNSVTSLGDYAFNECVSLTSVHIGNGLTSIGEDAFAACTSLTAIHVDAANTHYASVDGVLFNYAKDTLILYPAGNTRKEYTIPNSVIRIEGHAFEESKSLTSITFPNSVTSIGESAFYLCTSLTAVLLPKSVTNIEIGAFVRCSSLTAIHVDTANTRYTSVDGVLFNYAKDTLVQCPAGGTHKEYTIPNNVTSIGDEAFSWCKSLTSVTIPNSVTSIGKYAFEYCSSIKSITCYATTPPACGRFCFSNITKSIPVYVPEESIDAYKAANVWKDFTNIQAIATDIKNVNENANANRKVMRNGQLLILNNGHSYTLSGTPIE